MSTQPTVLDTLKEKCTSCYILRLSECLILFGIDDNIKTKNVFDLILRLAKQYLYKCKIEKQLLNTDIFRGKKNLKNDRYETEEYNAKMSCSCSSFSPKWERYRLILQANALIYLSFSCMFIHSMFMTDETLTVSMPHVHQCPMYVCL